MSRRFDVAALARVAVIDERSGANLYAKMADRAESARLKERFRWLREQEKKHEKRFSQMLEELEQQPPTQYPDEYVDYLEILSAQGGRAGELEGGLDRARGDDELLRIAMRFEREQLALQRDMADALGDEHGRVAEAVIQEERGHLVLLSRLEKEIGAERE